MQSAYRTIILIAVLALSAMCALTRPASAQLPTVTGVFDFTAPNGLYPRSDLVHGADGNLYGTTADGGTNNSGTVFSITTSGALTTLHSFNGSDGANPQAVLVQASDGNLYGTTTAGGINGTGTVFSITTSGKLSTLHSFNGPDGANPQAGLVQASDGNLYGTTTGGGSSNGGTIFRITTSGALTTLHSFVGPDGASPQTGLVQASDGNLYGTTYGGGANGTGTIYAITPSGAVTTLHSFQPLVSTFHGGQKGGYTYTQMDGFGPVGGLIQATDGNLYGTTAKGDVTDSRGTGVGTLYKITTAGAFTKLYRFTGGSDGGNPTCKLMQASDGTLYGTSASTVFTITMGGVFTSIYGFGAVADPSGLIQLADGNIYGTTVKMGTSNFGAVFSITTAGAITTLYSFTYPFGRQTRAAGLTSARNGRMYGTAYSGGPNDSGTAFAITTSGVFAALYSFNGSDGANPSAGVVQASDGNLYGTTRGAGNPDDPIGFTGYGTVFKMTPSGALTTIHAFNGSDGADPEAGLVQASDGNLYGTTVAGGLNNTGTVFKITTSGSLTTLHSFHGPDGSDPVAGLIQATDGNLYGTTPYGGTSDLGTVFRISKSGVFTTLHSFDGFGAYPYAGLVQARNGKLYGTTHDGGVSSNFGTIFSITTSGMFATLHDFNGSDGANPAAGLIQASDGNLYGTTALGGTISGTVFSIATSGAFRSVYSFNVNGGFSSLNQATDGNLYGTTEGVGTARAGSIYRLSGIYAVPAITAISPASANARGLGFTLTVNGASFQRFSTVIWNGAPLMTTYVSATKLKAAVPAGHISACGTASITVVTGAGGGTSNAISFNIH